MATGVNRIIKFAQQIKTALHHKQVEILLRWSQELFTVQIVGRIATRCWMDGLGIESRRIELYRTRPERPRGPLNLL
jgi:hypothetical protein